MAIKTTYRTIGCRDTHCRRRITKSQTCQYDQQLYGNEYNSYHIIIESQQPKKNTIFCLAEGEDIWLLYKVYKAIPVSPNSFTGKKTKKENPKPRSIIQLTTTKSDLLAHTPTSDTHIHRTAGTLVLFPHLQSIYRSWTFKCDPNSHMQSLHLEKPRVDRKEDDQHRPFIGHLQAIYIGPS